jgi:hypothetical protein
MYLVRWSGMESFYVTVRMESLGKEALGMMLWTQLHNN